MKARPVLKLVEAPVHHDLPALTADEQDQLETCESIVRSGMSKVFEVGSALLTIKENKLCRASHGTFEEYCRERWGIGRSYAWRVVGAAERIKLLPEDSDLPKPANEFQNATIP